MAAGNGESIGRGHCLLLTGTVTWCLTCGASACVRARYLAQPCRGRARGFLVQARQRLLLGLHPSSRVPLGAGTIPEPGQSLPAGFATAVRKAELSGATAKYLGAGLGRAAARFSLAESPRLAALRNRVRTKEAAAEKRALPLKRRRLWGKQPSHGTPSSTQQAVRGRSQELASPLGWRLWSRQPSHGTPSSTQQAARGCSQESASRIMNARETRPSAVSDTGSIARPNGIASSCHGSFLKETEAELLELQRSGIPVTLPQVPGLAAKKGKAGAALCTRLLSWQLGAAALADPVLAQAEEELLELQQCGLLVTLPC